MWTSFPNIKVYSIKDEKTWKKEQQMVQYFTLSVTLKVFDSKIWYWINIYSF